MRYSRSFIFTRKEIPAETAGVSAILLLRAGMLQRQTGGIYSYLPPGMRVIRRIEKIIREELETAGGLELSLPLLQLSQSGPDAFCFKDKRGASWRLTASDEEAVTALAGTLLQSYKNLPCMLYNTGTRFTGSQITGTGPAYSREFRAIDIYRLAIDEAGFAEAYNTLTAVLENIFRRCGVETIHTEAAQVMNRKSGVLEYFAPAGESGEELLICPDCGAAFPAETAPCRGSAVKQPGTEALPAMENISTPGMRTVEEVTRFLGLQPEHLIKTLIFRADEQTVAALVRGDYEISTAKLQTVLGCRQLVPADEVTVREVTGAPVGFAGPVGLKKPVPLYADYSVRSVTLAVVGANAADLHLKNVAPGRDLPVDIFWHDLRAAGEGESCAFCSGNYRKQQGIKAAQVRLPGRFHSEKGKAFVLDRNGNKQLPWLVNCRINITALLAAIVEQNHDQQGIIWPPEAAPFRAIICPVGNDSQVLQAAEELYGECIKGQVDVLLDDRAEQAGVMFKDADLLGIPLRVTIGTRRLAEGMMELKLRANKEVIVIPREHIMETIASQAKKIPEQAAR